MIQQKTASDIGKSEAVGCLDFKRKKGNTLGQSVPTAPSLTLG